MRIIIARLMYRPLRIGMIILLDRSRRELNTVKLYVFEEISVTTRVVPFSFLSLSLYLATPLYLSSVRCF